MNGEHRLDQRLRQAGRSRSGTEPEPAWEMTPETQGRLVDELRRRRGRRAAVIVGAGGIALAGALVLVLVPHDAPSPQVGLAQPAQRPLATTPCVQVRIDGSSSACAGSLAISSSNVSSGPLPDVQTSPNGQTSSDGQTSLTVRVGQLITVALPQGSGVHWQNGVGVSTGTPGTGPGATGANGVVPAGSPNTAAGGQSSAGSSTGDVLEPNPSTSGGSASFRAVHSGVVVLYAEATVECPSGSGNTTTCTPGARVWSVVVTVSS